MWVTPRSLRRGVSHTTYERAWSRKQHASVQWLRFMAGAENLAWLAVTIIGQPERQCNHVLNTQNHIRDLVADITNKPITALLFLTLAWPIL